MGEFDKDLFAFLLRKGQAAAAYALALDRVRHIVMGTGGLMDARDDANDARRVASSLLAATGQLALEMSKRIAAGQDE